MHLGVGRVAQPAELHGEVGAVGEGGVPIEEDNRPRPAHQRRSVHLHTIGGGGGMAPRQRVRLPPERAQQARRRWAASLSGCPVQLSAGAGPRGDQRREAAAAQRAQRTQRDGGPTSRGPSFQMRSPATPRASWFTAMSSSADRMASACSSARCQTLEPGLSLRTWCAEASSFTPLCSAAPPLTGCPTPLQVATSAATCNQPQTRSWAAAMRCAALRCAACSRLQRRTSPAWRPWTLLPDAQVVRGSFLAHSHSTAGAARPLCRQPRAARGKQRLSVHHSAQPRPLGSGADII